MKESSLFGRIPSGQANEARKERMRAGNRILAEESHEEAQQIIKLLEFRRQQEEEGPKTRIGRIGLIAGVGINRPEIELRYPTEESYIFRHVGSKEVYEEHLPSHRDRRIEEVKQQISFFSKDSMLALPFADHKVEILESHQQELAALNELPPDASDEEVLAIQSRFDKDRKKRFRL